MFGGRYEVEKQMAIREWLLKVGDDVALIGRGYPIKGALTELTDSYAKSMRRIFLGQSRHSSN